MGQTRTLCMWSSLLLSLFFSFSSRAYFSTSSLDQVMPLRVPEVNMDTPPRNITCLLELELEYGHSFFKKYHLLTWTWTLSPNHTWHLLDALWVDNRESVLCCHPRILLFLRLHELYQVGKSSFCLAYSNLNYFFFTISKPGYSLGAPTLLYKVSTPSHFSRLSSLS